MVQSRLGEEYPRDCRINRSMTSPMDVRVGIELIPISAVNEGYNPLEVFLLPKEASPYRAIG